MDEILEQFKLRGESLKTTFRRLTGRTGRPNSISHEDQAKVLELYESGVPKREIVRKLPM